MLLLGPRKQLWTTNSVALIHFSGHYVVTCMLKIFIAAPDFWFGLSPPAASFLMTASGPETYRKKQRYILTNTAVYVKNPLVFIFFFSGL